MRDQKDDEDSTDLQKHSKYVFRCKFCKILYGISLKDHFSSINNALKQKREWILLKYDWEEALGKKYGNL